MGNRVEAICMYDHRAPLTTMQVEDTGECFRFHIVTEHGNHTCDIHKSDITILEGFIRNRREHLKDQQVH